MSYGVDGLGRPEYLRPGPDSNRNSLARLHTCEIWGFSTEPATVSGFFYAIFFGYGVHTHAVDAGIRCLLYQCTGPARRVSVGFELGHMYAKTGLGIVSQPYRLTYHSV